MPLVGILGGMGPAATGQFLLELTRATPASRDQDHLRSIIICDPSVPDRTEAILRGDDAPEAVIREHLFTLVDMGADLLAVPCNTAHVFIDRFAAELPVPLVHIVTATLDAAQEASPTGAWLTATRGTIATRLYQDAAEERGYTLHVPGEKDIDALMGVIALVKAGEMARAGARYMAIADSLFARIPVPALTACTELPLAFDASGLPSVRSVSSLTALARATVAQARALGAPPAA